MISATTLPRPQAQFVDGSGRPTREFYDFLRGLIQLIQSVNGDTSAIADLLARVEALEAGGGSDAIIQGLMSVAVNGTLAGGVVQILLQGDVQSPGNTYYYGSDADGVRGWFPVADALDVTPDLTIAVGSDGVITFGLPDVPDTGGGTLQKTEFDAKGRKTGTSPATTDDLAEGVTNLYFTDERAQDAVGAAIAAGTGDGVTLSYDDAGNAIDATNTDKGSVAVAAHVAQPDPHPQYLTHEEGSVAFDPAGAAASALAAAIEYASAGDAGKVDKPAIPSDLVFSRGDGQWVNWLNGGMSLGGATNNWSGAGFSTVLTVTGATSSAVEVAGGSTTASGLVGTFIGTSTSNNEGYRRLAEMRIFLAGGSAGTYGGGWAILTRTRDSTAAPTTRFGVTDQGNLHFGTGSNANIFGDSYGSGLGVSLFVNASTVPTGNPYTGGMLWASGGGGYWRTSAGHTVNFAPATPPGVSGSKGGNAALASLITALAGLGLITDSTT